MRQTWLIKVTLKSLDITNVMSPLNKIVHIKLSAPLEEMLFECTEYKVVLNGRRPNESNVKKKCLKNIRGFHSGDI